MTATDLTNLRPGDLATISQLVNFTDAWITNRGLSANTREAYRRDVLNWLSWCETNGVVPLAAKFTHVNSYARELEYTVDPRTGRTLSPSTIARKLGGVSSWYGFMVRVGLLTVNPVDGADRPRVDLDHSKTIGLTSEEVDRLLAAAAKHSKRLHALFTLMADLGLRISEVVGLDLADLLYEHGHYTVRFTAKGGKQRRRALSLASAEAINAYLSERAIATGVKIVELTGPVFVTATGGPMNRPNVTRYLQKLAAQARVPNANKLSPHSLRHAFATSCREEGISLEDTQEAMGHSDPRTTRRYHDDRARLDKDPSYTLAAARARRLALEEAALAETEGAEG